MAATNLGKVVPELHKLLCRRKKKKLHYSVTHWDSNTFSSSTARLQKVFVLMNMNNLE